MSRIVLVLAAGAALLLLLGGGVLAQPQNAADRYIVVFEDGVQRPAAVASE